MDLRGFIQSVSDEAEKNIRKEECDYIGENGLLYCGKCHTKKQTIVRMPFGEFRPYCLCKCATEERNKRKEEEERKEFEEHIRKLRNEGFPQKEMKSWTFDIDDGTNKITDVARRYVNNFDEMRAKGKGLLLFGTVGTGKTFASACIVNALIGKGVPCLMTNFTHLVNSIGSYFGDEKTNYIESLCKYQLIAIDDLGVERATEYMGEQVFNIINHRYCSGLPLIVTTNLSADELKHPKDIRSERIYSRLFEMCIPIEVKGNDRRKEKLKDDFCEYREMLGL